MVPKATTLRAWAIKITGATDAPNLFIQGPVVGDASVPEGCRDNTDIRPESARNGTS